MSDAELLHRVQRGDTAAWRTLYARCLPGVWRYASVMVQDVSVTEDIVSETMLSFVQNLMKLDADAGTLHAWLHGVVRHKVGDHRRRLVKERRMVAAIGAGASSPRAPAEPAHPLEQEEACHHVQETLDQLPTDQRLVLEWKYLDRMSVREMAARLGLTEKSVESTLYRARREFRHLFEHGCQNQSSWTHGDPIGEPTSESSR